MGMMKYYEEMKVEFITCGCLNSELLQTESARILKFNNCKKTNNFKAVLNLLQKLFTSIFNFSCSFLM